MVEQATDTPQADVAEDLDIPERLVDEPTNVRGMSIEQIAEQARTAGIRAELFDEEEYTDEEFEGLLEMYDETLVNIEQGDIVQAKVLRVTDKAVILDVGFKSEGAVNRDEFKDPDSLQPGDEVEVFLERLEDDDGVVVLSKKKADFLRVWEKIREAHEAETPVPGTLSRKIKGGVTVDLMGVDAFLPGSQIALRRVPNIEDLIGETYDFKIIKLNKRRRNIVVSRRVLLEADREVKRDKLKDELEVGQIRHGVVKNITDFGAFIDLGGMDGLLHITDMSWGRVGHPNEVVQIGEEVDVKVLDIDWERERLSLGLKQLMPYPWTDVDKKYPVGSRIRGKVVSITNYGAFIELEKGVEGLVHISEMSWTRNVRHPSQVVTLGDEVEAAVLRVDVEGEKISLGMKQIEEDPWQTLPAKYPTGTTITGVVRNLTSFGAFVEVEPGIDGLVHISDMSWTRRIEHPSEVVQKGDEVEVMILSIDPDGKRISLGMKQTQEDPWDDIVEQYPAGTELTAPISRFDEKNVIVDLGDDAEGFVPFDELGANLPDPSAFFEKGDELELRVLEADRDNRRIVLTVTRIPKLEAGAVVPAPKEEAEEQESEEPAAEQVESEEDVTEEPAAEQGEAEEAVAKEPVAEQTEPEAEATAQAEPEAEAAEEPEAKKPQAEESAAEASADAAPEAGEEEEVGDAKKESEA